jgi:hypothetical protein
MKLDSSRLSSFRLAGEHIERAFDGLPQREVGGFECESASFYLGEIENVADDGHQGVGRGLDDAREFGLLGIERGIQQQVGHADHAIERRANLVAHGGQEIALEPGRLFGSVLGIEQMLLQLALLAGVGEHGHRAQSGTLQQQGGTGDLDRQQAAVLADETLVAGAIHAVFVHGLADRALVRRQSACRRVDDDGRSRATTCRASPRKSSRAGVRLPC